MRRALLRPPFLFWLSTNGQYGSPLCNSGLTTLMTKRRPGEVGLVLTTAIAFPLFRRRQVDGLTGREANVRLLPVVLARQATLRLLFLAAHVQRRHVFDA